MDGVRRHTHTVALVGAPNTGKSTFFNRLAGASARVGNWPGVTVDITTARIVMGGEMVKFADLPGVYSLEARLSGYATPRYAGLKYFADTKPIFTIVLVCLALIGEFVRFWYDYDARMKVLEAERAAKGRSEKPYKEWNDSE